MSNEIRRKPEMTKANPYNDIKLLFCVLTKALSWANITTLYEFALNLVFEEKTFKISIYMPKFYYFTK